MTTPLLLQSRRVWLPEGEAPASLLVREGRIAAVLPHGADVPSDVAVADFGEDLIMPGVVDTHVHLNEPGRTEWEGFATATQAAVSGGITTLVDMPLNSSPVTTSLAALRTKQAHTKGQLWADVGFWGGVVPGNAHELLPMVEAGVCGFKAFMCHSGLDEYPQSYEADLREAMRVLAPTGVPLLLHAELEPEGFVAPEGDPRAYATFLASRPSSWEVEAVKLAIRLCRETGCRVHIVHLASAEALPFIAEAKREGLPFTVETCPHYLSFCAEEVPEGATHFKCCPPIREASHREGLWQGLLEGTIDFVACDHSPCTPGLKLLDEGDFLKAWGGIAGLQFSLHKVWTEAKARGIGLERLVAWLCTRTAAFAGLDGRKGAFRVGLDADAVVWRPEASFQVAAEAVRHRHRLTPYLGLELQGVVVATYLRGQHVCDGEARLVGPLGQMLSRG